MGQIFAKMVPRAPKYGPRSIFTLDSNLAISKTPLAFISS